jgi:superfamily I DNA/RNA helicase
MRFGGGGGGAVEDFCKFGASHALALVETTQSRGRVFYVALTKAKNELYLNDPTMNLKS